MTTVTPSALVQEFLYALNKEDYDTARLLLDDQFVFKGVLGERNGADAYMEDMKKMKFKYKVSKIFNDTDEAAVWYEVIINGKHIPSAGRYKLENNRITHYEVIFDPRQLLEKQ